MRLLRAVLALALIAAPATAAAQRPLSSAERDSLVEWIAALSPELGGVRIDPDAAHTGEHVIASGTAVPGDLVAYRGTIEVHGSVAGNVVAFGGDVVLHPDAHVRGDALAVGGTIRQEGGRVDGEIRSVAGHAPGIAPLFATRAAPPRSAQQLLSLVAAWFAVLAAVAFAVLLLARANLTTIASRIRSDFGRSLLVGVAGQLAIAPALLLLIVGLAITVIGMLLIPFALVAFLLAVVGIGTLGFLAMAHQNGRAVRRRSDDAADETVADITTNLMIGLAVYFVLWAVAAIVGPLGVIGALLRAMVVVITWVAISVGFGAAILSRGGTRSAAAAAQPDDVEDDFSWQTPTPVSGVVAARRPTPAPRPAERQ